MSLIEKFFPVARTNFDFFHHISSQIDREFQQMEEDRSRARNLLLQLVPRDQSDIMKQDIKPSIPVVEERGESKLKLEFNVNQFKPEELEVKLLGNKILQVTANHEEHSDSGMKKVSYLRQYSLPDGIDFEHIKPQLHKDGVLTVEAPAPALKPKERMIPIEYSPAK